MRNKLMHTLEINSICTVHNTVHSIVQYFTVIQVLYIYHQTITRDQVITIFYLQKKKTQRARVDLTILGQIIKADV